MKNLLLSVFAMVLSFVGISQSTTRFQTLSKNYALADAVFEGTLTKTNPSYYNPKNEIHTKFDVTVNRNVKGTADGASIVLDFEGGSITDPKTGLTTESSSSHGPNGPPRTKALFFVTKNTDGSYKTFQIVSLDNPNSVIANPQYYGSQPYQNLTQFYADLSSISGVVLKTQKKSPEITERTINEQQIPYEEQVKNYNSLLEKKLKQAQLSAQLQQGNSKTTSTDLILDIVGGTITGSSTKYFEFDVLMKSNTSAYYFDNTAVHISYNTTVFGTNIVAANNVQVANAPALNNPNYINANSYKNDISTNVFAFAIGTDPFLTNPVRVNITTGYQTLAHVKMKILNCGSNVNLALANAATAINVSFYATTQTASSFNSYDNLFYQPGLISQVVSCGPGILDFTSPVNGGIIGVNEILTIKGYNFGATRGNGQVKFRNADEFGFPYFNKLDNMDYLIWNDTLIQIRMPSTIDTINPNLDNTPGSGPFKVVTNANDSTVSGLNQFLQPFKVYFSIYNTRPGTASTVSRGQKIKANLYKSVNSTGGYVLRLDTSVSNYPQMKMCVQKAAKTWNCFTASNLKLGTDTTMRVVASDNICNIFVVPASQMADPSFIASTKRNTSICPTGPIRVIVDFDIKINANYVPLLFCDTTGATLPATMFDFLEVMEHELGHGLGLEHVIDSAMVMYYRSLGGQPSNISGGQRRFLQPFTSDVDGGDNQVANSGTYLSGQCGLQDMVQLTSGSCAVIGVHEITAGSFNVLMYPNPSTDGKVNISFDLFEAERPSIEIYDMVGKIVYSEALPTSINNHYVHTINLGQIANGVYILNIKAKNSKASYKVIKQ